MTTSTPFKLTYATMFNPPEELHKRFETALAEVKSEMGKEHAMLIGGKEYKAGSTFEDRSPIDTDWVLGYFQKGDEKDAANAIEAARRAFPDWSARPWQERVTLMRKAADLITQRIFKFGAVIALEVGKNRMEALGDIAEAADLIRYACDQITANNGFVKEMGRDPLSGYKATNYSVLRPYGVWLIISPFNFPGSLTGGPAGAALAAGNTVVIKPASDTPWTSRLLAECFRDAGLPDGVFNYVTGPGSSIVRRSSRIRAWMASPSPVPMMSAWVFIAPSLRALMSARPSWKWAARMPPLSARMPMSKMRLWESCALPLACRDRSARPARGFISRNRSIKKCWTA
jgi:1-pyrroline-5-carboxylate dehydrogenase